MSSKTEPIRPYDDEQLIKYDKFVVKRLKLKARKPFFITFYVLLFSGGLLLGYNYVFNSYSNEQLFDRYFDSYNIANDRDYDHMQAIKHYQNGDFELAIKLFTELSGKDTVIGSDDFYLAVSYAKCKNYYKAIGLLNKIIADNNNDYCNISHWYLGLCYLKLYKNNEAKEQFQFVVQYGDEHNEDALMILNQLKN